MSKFKSPIWVVNLGILYFAFSTLVVFFQEFQQATRRLHCIVLYEKMRSIRILLINSVEENYTGYFRLWVSMTALLDVIAKASRSLFDFDFSFNFNFNFKFLFLFFFF